MDAIMQALLGGDALTDDDKLRQTAEALRGSDNAAQVFSMSSIAPIAKAAQNQRSLLSDAARRGGILRESALRRKQEKEISDSALKRALAQRNQDREWKLADDERARQAARDLQLLKNSGKSGSGTLPNNMGKITASEYEKLGKEAKILEQGNLVMNALGEIGGEGYSTGNSGFIGDAIDQVAKKISVVQTEAQEKRAHVQRLFDKYEVLEQRHELFGGALTEGEQKAWDEATISPIMKPEVIERNLRIREDLQRRAVRRWFSMKKERGFNDDQIRAAIDQRVLADAFGGDEGLQKAYLGDYSGRPSSEKLEKATKVVDDRDNLIARQRANITPGGGKVSEVVAVSLEKPEDINDSDWNELSDEEKAYAIKYGIR